MKSPPRLCSAMVTIAVLLLAFVHGQFASAMSNVLVNRMAVPDSLALSPHAQCRTCATFKAQQSVEVCSCKCDGNSSFFEPTQKCVEDRSIRQNAGCATLFKGESLDSGLHLFDPAFRNNVKLVQIPSGQECRVNQEGAANEYLDCDGTWERIWPAAIDNKFERLLLPGGRLWSSGPYAIRVKLDNTGSTDHLNGRIVKLDMECRLKNRRRTKLPNNCLLFKIAGRVNCLLQNVSMQVHSPLPHTATSVPTKPPSSPPPVDSSTAPPIVLATETATLSPTSASTTPVKASAPSDSTLTASPPVRPGNSDHRQGNSARIGIIAGAAVGGCVLLIAFILVLVKVCCTRKSRQKPRQHQFHVHSPGPVFQNPLSTFPVYTDAANSRSASPTQEKTASMSNPSYMRAADGSIIPCGPILSDKSPNGPPPRPNNARDGIHSHANEGFVSEKDTVVMNPLYESKQDVACHKVSNLERRHSSRESSLAYDIPEEILDELRRTAESYSPPEYQEAQKARGNPKTTAPRRGRFYDVPETTKGEQVYVLPETEIYDDVVPRRGDGKHVNSNPALHVISPGGTDTQIDLKKPFCYSSGKPGLTKPKHPPQVPRLTVASVGTTSPATKATVSPNPSTKTQQTPPDSSTKTPPTPPDSPTGKGSGSPKAAIKIKKPVQKPRPCTPPSARSSQESETVYDDVVAAMSSRAFRS